MLCINGDLRTSKRSEYNNDCRGKMSWKFLLKTFQKRIYERSKPALKTSTVLWFWCWQLRRWTIHCSGLSAQPYALTSSSSKRWIIDWKSISKKLIKLTPSLECSDWRLWQSWVKAQEVRTKFPSCNLKKLPQIQGGDNSGQSMEDGLIVLTLGGN